jgi:hypothetical protein
LKALVGLIVFVVLPIALVLWIYYVVKKHPAKVLPAEGRRDTFSMFRTYYKEHGRKVLPLLVSVGVVWLMALALRIHQLW